ncbi:MAG: Na+/H+ antiporter subunit E [Oceanospirillales bacterium]|uniref:Multisubunit potassium/proton antiporter PhaE subunit n=1 Tax=Marinobacterium halophilum TaxID=267374 RepID=A0A2P8ESE0_9GAMM|nr:Na+/H+ antiporter subunit E [Marinobacterium halophilum]MBR9828521.1 Na+/H+ antiporter subunit E [Oceanospirillales bacterium]PSL12406.1 multisubunit potassium/proton antiporter PhaE subunit [Marinobacterium halophilum]
MSRSRWLPMPLHSLLLLVVWLLLNNTVSPGHLVLGTFLAFTIPLLCAPLQTPQPRVHRPLLALRYMLRVLGDIVVANIEVAVLVLGPMRKLQPGFVAIPLDIESELPITLLASTVSLTPGTVSAELSDDRRWLYVHALHLTDEQALIDTVKSRYEAPLKEIFAC